MNQRMEYASASPEPMKAMFALGSYLERCGLESSLLELVKIRASQINGCGFCLDMHTKDARAAGETEQRIYLLNVWREAPQFTDRERAALAWTEAVTRIADGGPSDEVYEQARGQFSEKELTDLTWAAVVINSYNRLAVSFRITPGTYKVGQFKV